ncbi:MULTISPECIES: helix-turn-helix transcriptional regulator [Chryseobacterium]|uniref:Transcriptional regulator with XRE-family HTH domain n=1 Tax=Chryseobacterium camelliae TaxID=1265445 RepID=A0ABU0TIJ1_9FLAO|nr:MULTISPECIES: helix-turn-helix transcriptional regulator [Chryseobacterium]MDT3409261.1 transcriptional regulator with XRE-family HTH domain [Pseudacidovorax intermedius]MDQ1096877.1 transcriptional regulator with XRE-family HTH domain [Chryseobacterium camelliae]MDQ1100819.1 transcriptional regulator with XRE-family HTH domain [Chryseobacterium sp. SORGH_AS_1048]MDR6084260.1 transcriptional regulator with XRE-family HTH domain [Chryseobacterium sp. SORGH_AS_0909]MDR6132533.1 transcriptiona
MIKHRLILVRKNKKLSQAYIAKALCMDTSNYNRREKGEVKISISEWKKLADILGVSIDDILEEDTPQIFISNDNPINKAETNHYNIPLSLWEIQKKYIQKLEQENQELRYHIAEKDKKS